MSGARLAKIALEAALGTAEYSLTDLTKLLCSNGANGTLACVFELEKLLSEAGLKLVPDLKSGEMDAVRRVVVASAFVESESSLAESIGLAESEIVERKSSLLYDHARAQVQPDASAKELKSMDVCFAVLKTINAFMSSKGGKIFVGVADDGVKLGIEYDLQYVKGGSRDGWELLLRDKIKSDFMEGASINDYVDVRFAVSDSKCVGVLSVSSRRKLTFLRHGGAYHLYRRQGNRTEEVRIEELENFIQRRT